MDLEKPHPNNSSASPFHPVQMAIVVLGLISGVAYFFNFRLQSVLGATSGIDFYVFVFLTLSLLYLIGIHDREIRQEEETLKVDLDQER